MHFLGKWKRRMVNTVDIVQVGCKVGSESCRVYSLEVFTKSMYDTRIIMNTNLLCAIFFIRILLILVTNFYIAYCKVIMQLLI